MQIDMAKADEWVTVSNAAGSSSVVLVCEHASPHIPWQFNSLGLSAADAKSHVAWDPGAMAVAEHLAKRLGAVLVASNVSRLIYDCNRPPDAPGAMPARSEIVDVPGNRALSAADRETRTQTYYRPFQATLRRIIAQTQSPIVVTVHSFTPIYHGQARAVEIGVLHDSDTRLADAMLATASAHTTANVQRNEPYGPEHGVTHTLREHALPAGHLNVMLEIRNDLIATAETQQQLANTIAHWLVAATEQINVQGAVQCQA